MIKEFKEFIAKGNVMDMAIGVIMGGAFGKIVSALVENILNPIIGILTGGTTLANLGIVLVEATEGSEAVILQYGAFLQAILDFLIIAIFIFFMVKGMNKLNAMGKKDEEIEEVPAGPTTEELLVEIRDELKKAQ